VFGAEILSDAVFETKSELAGDLKRKKEMESILSMSD